jgi:glycopeptide antibiotics resistance protein
LFNVLGFIIGFLLYKIGERHASKLWLFREVVKTKTGNVNEVLLPAIAVAFFHFYH